MSYDREEALRQKIIEYSNDQAHTDSDEDRQFAQMIVTRLEHIFGGSLEGVFPSKDTCYYQGSAGRAVIFYDKLASFASLPDQPYVTNHNKIQFFRNDIPDDHALLDEDTIFDLTALLYSSPHFLKTIYADEIDELGNARSALNDIIYRRGIYGHEAHLLLNVFEEAVGTTNRAETRREIESLEERIRELRRKL